MKSSTAAEVIERDEKEPEEHGQDTRGAFALADVFVSSGDAGPSEDQVRRFLELIFAHPFRTPTKDECGMFAAYGSSLRSGSLSRQVGAAILTDDGSVISVGCNDVACPGGGLYNPGPQDQRDHAFGYDSNEKEKRRIVAEIVREFDDTQKDQSDDACFEVGKKRLRRSGILDITEFGREVHAEMDALLSAARLGTSVRGSTLYTTTFPCHNCAKHIVAAGIKEVVFVEPYPKSKVPELFPDSVTLDSGSSGIPFRPFIGVGPRRYFDLFSMALGSGRRVVRKRGGDAVNPNETMGFRTPCSWQHYVNMEDQMAESVPSELSDSSIHQQEDEDGKQQEQPDRAAESQN